MMKGLRYVIPLTSAFALMLAARALVVSVHSVNGNGLAPLFQNGDQLLINRCSYGMRIEGNALLSYSRLMRKPVQKGDIVAFTWPGDSIKGLLIARCTA
ncbi:MAG: S26 family signal peptidase, partial [Prevotella sp.]|nr:S26 family signal peptidase [Prevotella sp.]